MAVDCTIWRTKCQIAIQRLSLSCTLYIHLCYNFFRKEQFPITISVTRLAVPMVSAFYQVRSHQHGDDLYRRKRTGSYSWYTLLSQVILLAVNIHHQGPHAFFKASKTPLSVASCTSTTFSLDFEPEPIETSLFFTPSTCMHARTFTQGFQMEQRKWSITCLIDRLHLYY